MQTSNPVFRNDPFAAAPVTGAAMTVGGTVWKTAFLLMLAMVTGTATWVISARIGNVMPAIFGAMILGLILGLAISFKPTWAAVLAPIYALVQGVLLGGISAFYNARYPGIAVAAAGGTAATLAGLLFAYQTGIIRASDNFKRGVIAATLGIGMFYLVTMGLSFFNIQVPGVFGSGWVGIGFSVFVVIIAAMNLVLDFDFIERGARGGAPKYMEWYGAFGLMVTLIWLYLEILRLLAKVAGRR